MVHRLTLVAVAVALAGCGGGGGGGPTESAGGNAVPDPPNNRPELPRANSAAAFRVVTIDIDKSQLAHASAFFVSGDGLAVTCAHVVDGVTPLGAVLRDGRQVDVEVVASDPASDLALLQVDGGGPFSFIPSAGRVAAAGERVWTVTKDGLGEGRITGRCVDDVVGEALELTTSLGPGGSGGAVVGVDGRLLGVIRGAVNGDPEQTVAILACRVGDLLAAREVTTDDAQRDGLLRP